MNLIFLYGPPAVGTLTVAKELSKLTGYKIFHNHLVRDLVESLFDVKTEKGIKIVQQLRVDLLVEAAKSDIPGVIFTFAYAYSVDNHFVEKILKYIKENGGSLYLVQLYCDKKELLKRVTFKERKKFAKICEPKTLSAILKQYDLFTPYPDKEHLRINNTNITPQEAAKRIFIYYKLRH